MAKIVKTGELSFTVEEHKHCGTCEVLASKCACPEDPLSKPSQNYTYENLPAPKSTTRDQLLHRWLSLVVKTVHPNFMGKAWYSDNFELICKGLTKHERILSDWVEKYAAQFPSDPDLPALAKAIGLETSCPPEEGVKPLSEEVRIALRLFQSGDWACMTQLGAILLQNAFPVERKVWPKGPEMPALFEAVTIIKEMMEMGYTNVRLAIENERSPVVLNRTRRAAATPPAKDRDLLKKRVEAILDREEEDENEEDSYNSEEDEDYVDDDEESSEDEELDLDNLDEELEGTGLGALLEQLKKKREAQQDTAEPKKKRKQ